MPAGATTPKPKRTQKEIFSDPENNLAQEYARQVAAMTPQQREQYKAWGWRYRKAIREFEREQLINDPDKIFDIFEKSIIKDSDHPGCHVWNYMTVNTKPPRPSTTSNGHPRFGPGILSPVRTTYARHYIATTMTGMDLKGKRIKMMIGCHPLCVNPVHMFFSVGGGDHASIKTLMDQKKEQDAKKVEAKARVRRLRKPKPT